MRPCLMSRRSPTCSPQTRLTLPSSRSRGFKRGQLGDLQCSLASTPGLTHSRCSVCSPAMRLSCATRRSRHRRRTPHARARLIPTRRRPRDGHRAHGLPDGGRQRRRCPRRSERSRRTRHPQSLIPCHGQSGDNRPCRRPAGPVMALPHTPPSRWVSLRRRHGPT